MDKEIEKIELKWDYSPKSYVRDEIIIQKNGVEIKISEGTAMANIDPGNKNSIEDLKIELTESIKNRLEAIQVLQHKQFSLSKPSRSDYYKGGNKHIYLSLESISVKSTISSVDFVHKDKDGNVIFDSKKERIEKEKQLAKAINKYRSSDWILDQMLNSYQRAVEDPEDELIHLFEIVHALESKFDGANGVRKKLDFDHELWKPLRSLANNPQIKQGRHRGESAGNLRDAKESEIKKARNSAKNLIVKYLEYKESNDAA